MSAVSFFDFTSTESQRTSAIRSVTRDLALTRGYGLTAARKLANCAVEVAKWWEGPDDVARRVVPRMTASATQGDAA